MAPKNVADRVNLGLIPTSSLSWQTACQVLNQQRGGFLHIHENVDTGVNSIQDASDVGSGCISNKTNVNGLAYSYENDHHLTGVLANQYNDRKELQCVLNENNHDNADNGLACNNVKGCSRNQDNVDFGSQCISIRNIDNKDNKTKCNLKNDVHGVFHDATVNQDGSCSAIRGQAPFSFDCGDINDKTLCISNSNNNNGRKSDEESLRNLENNVHDFNGVTANQCNRDEKLESICTNKVNSNETSNVLNGPCSCNTNADQCFISRAFGGKKLSENKRIVWCNFVTVMIGKLKGYLSQTFLPLPMAEWSVCLRHVELVKSYAPHVDHLVFDVECRPIS